MAIQRLTKYEDLLASLSEGGVPHQAQGTNSIEMKVPNGDSVILRWEEGLPYVQVIYPFIANVPPEREAAVASAVCRVNNTVKLPGFGYTRDGGLIYMRLAVWLDDEGGISTNAFAGQVRAAVQNASEFAAAFRDVVAGAPAADVIDLALEHNKKR